MKRNLVLIFVSTMLLLFGCATNPPTPAAGGIQISEVWARTATMNSDSSMGMGAKGNGATYLTIQNNGAADKLVKAESDIAETTELHNVTEVNGVMQMRPVAGIDVPANGTLELKPGGFHIMLIALKRDLKPGDMIDLTLTFEKAGVQQVHAAVRAQ